VSTFTGQGQTPCLSPSSAPMMVLRLVSLATCLVGAFGRVRPAGEYVSEFVRFVRFVSCPVRVSGSRRLVPDAVRSFSSLVQTSGSRRGEEFLFSGQVRPSAAAAGRRAGPVLAPLRAAGPAAAHSRKPGDPENEKSSMSPGLPSARTGWSGLVLSVADCLHGCPPPVKAADASWRITLRVSLDRRRSPRRSGHYEEMPSE
jgi:hypothetical protein